MFTGKDTILRIVIRTHQNFDINKKVVNLKN